MSGCFIIAEAGVNHNGDLARALALIDIAAEAGADAVKFQTFKADSIATAGAGRAAYQQRTVGAGDQVSMLRALELDDEAHARLAEHCRDRGIAFLSTPFEAESIPLLTRLGMTRLKVPSGEITNPLLLLGAVASGLPVILSTGMATLDDVQRALGVLAFGFLGRIDPSAEAFAAAYADPAAGPLLRERVTLLHCTSEYPAAPESINLRAMDTLADTFGLAVGLSDHSQGIAVPIAAAARGATVVEKHFTEDRSLPGPDHAASLEPDELRQMVAGIRAVTAALGSGEKAPTDNERDTAAVARRSLVAARAIAAGERLTADALAVKRPGTGMSPMLYWDILGQPATRAYEPGDLINEAAGR